MVPHGVVVNGVILDSDEHCSSPLMRLSPALLVSFTELHVTRLSE